MFCSLGYTIMRPEPNQASLSAAAAGDDRALRDAINSAGRRQFAKAAARAFAGIACLGDAGLAAEVARLWSAPGLSKKGWCTEATLVAARKLFPPGPPIAVRCAGREAVLLSGSIMGGGGSAELAAMIRAGDVAGALEHSCALLAHGCGAAAWDAAVAAAPAGLRRGFVISLRAASDACGPTDAGGARALLEAAVAAAAGELRVRRSALMSADDKRRAAAMYSCVNGPAAPRRRSAPCPAETKTLELPNDPGLRPCQSVVVIKGPGQGPSQSRGGSSTRRGPS